jgi:hypothetical protein
MLEIRLFTRSLKPLVMHFLLFTSDQRNYRARWLSRVVDWACTSHSGAMISAKDDQVGDQATQKAWTPVTDDVINEVDKTFDSIRALYSSSWLGSISATRTVSNLFHNTFKGLTISLPREREDYLLAI